jgi:hypothetical protein
MMATLVIVNGETIFSAAYTILIKRISHVVLLSDSTITEVKFFIIDTDSMHVFAIVQLFSKTNITEKVGKHIVSVQKTNTICVIPADTVTSVLMFMSIGSNYYVSCRPNKHGHGTFK